jgi:predicted TIM-barrel fold metal-dependent hydrolase
MAEFLPPAMLRFMDEHGLIMMLHTPGYGVGEKDVRDSLVRILERYPGIRIILAHLGRYVRAGDFLTFLRSGVFYDHPALTLEMSSATDRAVYREILAEPDYHRRLLFGSDLPFGLITGVERWSDERGAIFLSRDTYSWSDPAMNAAFSEERKALTYNTYHVIKAFKGAMEDLAFDDDEAGRIKERVFRLNAVDLCAGD